MTALEYRAYHAWDASTRWFHWINALAVIGLIATGLVVLNDDALGLSAGGKILLKSIHVSIGYAMGANLLWRFIWAFFGNRYTRWRGILPGGSGYLASLRAYIVSFLSGEPQQYIGHNPVARIGDYLVVLASGGSTRHWARNCRYGSVLAALWALVCPVGCCAGR